MISAEIHKNREVVVMFGKATQSLLLLVGLFLSNHAAAMPILSGTGVIGLSQDESLYDVEFGDRGGATYLDVLTDPARAITTPDVLGGILDQIRGLLSTSSLAPSDISGCSGTECVIDFPFVLFEPVIPGGSQTVGGDSIFYEEDNIRPGGFVLSTSQTAEGNEVTFGFITEREDAAVPAPATLALLGLSLAALGFSRRKKV